MICAGGGSVVGSCVHQRLCVVRNTSFHSGGGLGATGSSRTAPPGPQIGWQRFSRSQPGVELLAHPSTQRCSESGSRWPASFQRAAAAGMVRRCPGRAVHRLRRTGIDRWRMSPAPGTCPTGAAVGPGRSGRSSVAKAGLAVGPSSDGSPPSPPRDRAQCLSHSSVSVDGAFASTHSPSAQSTDPTGFPSPRQRLTANCFC